MKFTAQLIANFLKGEIEGDINAEVWEISKIEEGKKGSLSFLSNPKYEKYIYSTESSIVLVNKDFLATEPVSATLVRVENAYTAFASLLDLYTQSKPVKQGIEPNSFIDPSASVGENIYIGAFAYLDKNSKVGNNSKIYPQVFIGENASVGENCIIYPGVKIYEGCKVGNNCIIHAGAVIGSDGFGFAPDANNVYKKIPQIGNVVIEDDVEIGANATLDRATMGSTIIRKGVKLDNQVHVAHNVEIGNNSVLAAQIGIAGSSKIGADCMFGGQVGIGGHISVADGVKLGAKTGVHASITEKGAELMGAPVMKISQFFRTFAVYKNLPDMNRNINNMEKRLKELESIIEKNKSII